MDSIVIQRFAAPGQLLRKLVLLGGPILAICVELSSFGLQALPLGGQVCGFNPDGMGHRSVVDRRGTVRRAGMRSCRLLGAIDYL